MVDICFYNYKNIKYKNKVFSVPFLSCKDWVLAYGTMCIYHELQTMREVSKTSKKLLKECIRDLWKATKIKGFYKKNTKIAIINEFIRINMPSDVVRWTDNFETDKQDSLSIKSKETYILDIVHIVAKTYKICPFTLLEKPFVAINSLFSLIRRDRLIEEYGQLGINLESIKEIKNYEMHKQNQFVKWTTRRNYVREILEGTQNIEITNPTQIKEMLAQMKELSGGH